MLPKHLHRLAGAGLLLLTALLVDLSCADDLAITWSRPRVIRNGNDYSGFANTPSSYMSLHKQITLSICDTITRGSYSRYKWSISHLATTAPDADGNTSDYFYQVDTITIATCKFNWKAPAEDTYTINVDVLDVNNNPTASASTNVTIKDIWFVVMGDSYIAGQGCPDTKAGLLGIIRPKWIDVNCYRSGNSFGFLTYSNIEQAYPDYGILFTYIPCSGASISPGLLSSYLGNRAQADAVKDIQKEATNKCKCDRCYCKTVPDVTLISIGGNDAKFSDVIVSLITGNPSDQLSAMPARLKTLRDRLSQMAKFFNDQLSLPAQSVFYTEYYDVLKDTSGTPNANCGGVGAANSMTFDMAETQIRKPVNQAIQDACTTNGWTFVDSMDDVYGTHGVCAQQPYINTVGESLNLQADIAGAFHPNYQGHIQTADAVWNQMKPYLDSNVS